MKEPIYPVLLLILNSFLSFQAISQTLVLNSLDHWIDQQLPSTLQEHHEFVSLPNVALSPTDMQKNIAWLEKAFLLRDFQVEALPTPSIPVVLASKIVDPALPTVLFYFHFDGQPVDPTKWDQKDPFLPVIKRLDENGQWTPTDLESRKVDPEWRIFGRSAADDKGPILMFLTAIDLIKKNDLSLPYNVKVLLDGEEEMSSGGLRSTLKQYREKYTADHLIIMDGPCTRHQPAYPDLRLPRHSLRCLDRLWPRGTATPVAILAIMPQTRCSEWQTYWQV